MKKEILETNFVCPQCHCPLEESTSALFCNACSRHYRLIDHVPDFRATDEYWCNVSRDKMNSLNNRAKETGDWLGSAKEIIPEYAEHFVPFYRADSQFLWPTNKDSVVLDAGSMWGGLTIPIAQFHREVYAVDKTVETLDFLKIRAEQMGLKNIYVAAASLKSLPFADNFFDHVVLNGVLEWIGLEEDTILEQHWKGKRDQQKKYSKSPKEMQTDVLKELRRVLKPTGSLYIAIENRYGIQYFLSHPDDHNNVNFITFMPRFWANWISKWAGKGEYRTYVYSPGQLTGLLEESGYKVNSMYGVAPHYIKIQKSFPLGMTKFFKQGMKVDRFIPKVLYRAVQSVIPASMMRHLVPSVFAICGKDQGNDPVSRLQEILIKQKVLKETDNVRLVISNNRYENYNSVNVIVYDADDNPMYFCKIARDLRVSGLQTEADNLRWISKRVPALMAAHFKIPKLIYWGETDGVEVLITSFLNAENAGLFPFCIVKMILNKIGIKNDFLGKKMESFEEKSFLRKMDTGMRQAMDALVAFQQATTVSKRPIKDILDGALKQYFQCWPNCSDDMKKNISRLKDQMKGMADTIVPICAVHGDYCFDNLLFFGNGDVGLTDFEHAEEKGSIFFDLAVLIFEPLVSRWKTSYCCNRPFSEYLNKYGGRKYIHKWLSNFCDQHKLPHSTIVAISLLAAVEQNIKIYPSFRDPYTYPMYGDTMFKEIALLDFNERR